MTREFVGGRSGRVGQRDDHRGWRQPSLALLSPPAAWQPPAGTTLRCYTSRMTRAPTTWKSQ